MRTAFLFPGQGARPSAWALRWPRTCPRPARCSTAPPTSSATTCSSSAPSGPEEKLNSTVHSQPALFVCSLAALEQLKHDAPDAVADCVVTAGLSLGEYTALAFAGALDFDAGLRVVAERGRAMQDAADAAPSGMVSLLGLERDKIEELCDQAREGDVLQIANLLCPGNIVVSGSKAACDRVAALAEAAGAMKVIPLAVAGAFHTPLMQPAVERLAAALAERRDPHAAHSGAVERRRPAARRSRGNPRSCSCGRSSAPSCGKTRCAACWPTTAWKSATKSAPAACWPACSNASNAVPLREHRRVNVN